MMRLGYLWFMFRRFTPCDTIQDSCCRNKIKLHDVKRWIFDYIADLLVENEPTYVDSSLWIPGHSKKIVFLPMFGGSSYLSLKRLAQELSNRGHEATLLVNSARDIKPEEGEEIKHVVYQVPFNKGFYERTFLSSLIQSDSKSVLADVYQFLNLTKIQQIDCESLLRDTNLLNSFREYDLLVADLENFCSPVVQDYLRIRRVGYIAGPPSLPFLPSTYDAFFTVSYVPQQLLTTNPVEMNFFQRLKNVAAFFALKALPRIFFFRAFQKLKMKYGIQPEKSYIESFLDKELTLFAMDFAYDHVQPVGPDYKLVGPLNIRPVRPLPPDLQQLIDSSGDDGAIIVSFGSNVASVLDKNKVDIMAEAFGRLKQKVIWKVQGYIPPSLNANIKVVDWLPQNDLLAHKKLRAFVSHCGLNSVYESLYRGVPVVSMPIYGDQFENAFRLEERGVALIADYKTLTADDLYNKIKRVVNEPSFRENAQRFSRLLKDRQRSPVQEAGDWIEYALRHKSLAHLRPYSSQLAWYQYFLVDVAVFLVLVVLVVIMVIKYTFRLIRWMCRQRDNLSDFGKEKTQ